MQKIIRLPEVRERVGLSGSGIYQLINKNQFPKQIKLGSRSTGWLESEIQEWIENRIRAARGE